jgi:TonB family protein
MRKTTFVRPISGCASLLCLSALGMICLPAFAQDASHTQRAPAAAVPSDPAAFMLLAAQSNGLSPAGGQSWHLKASYKTYDEQGNAKDQGVFEEFFVSPTKYKSSYSSTGFSQTTYGTEKGRLQSGSPVFPSFTLSFLRPAFVLHLPPAAQMANYDLAAEPREIDGANDLCVSMKTKPASPDAPAQIRQTSCFDAGTNFLRMILAPASQTAIKRSRPISFQGRSLPGDFELDYAGKIALSAHLEIIEPVTANDDDVFLPPPDAVLLQPMKIPNAGIAGTSPSFGISPGVGTVTISQGVAIGLLLQHDAPVYPPIAKAARVQGTVVLLATLSKTGQIKNLRVISGPAMLQQAAMDAVKQWVYKPYLLNGEPVEVQTTVNVNFKLSPPPSQTPPTPAMQ